MKKEMFILLVLLVGLFTGCSFVADNNVGAEIVDFDSCVRAGNDIIASIPRSCEANNITYIQPTLAERCEMEGGIWDYTYHECEGVSEQYCVNMIGGNYNECGSSCRHQPEGVLCTMQCVELCTLDLE